MQFPALDPNGACGAYIIFMTLNILGVGIAATFELMVTLLAIFELLVFMGVVARASPGATSPLTAGRARSFSGLALPGMFAAIPFAIWFFLAIEGASMAAEEERSAAHHSRALGGGILTLTVLAIGVMIAGGVGDWRTLANINDPLPQAMKMVVGNSSGWLHMLVWLGLFGLVASFHGIIMGYSRQITPGARGLSARQPGDLNRRTRTPHLAILAGGVVGIAAIFRFADHH
jgi:ethanolamine permease